MPPRSPKQLQPVKKTQPVMHPNDWTEINGILTHLIMDRMQLWRKGEHVPLTDDEQRAIYRFKNELQEIAGAPIRELPPTLVHSEGEDDGY